MKKAFLVLLVIVCLAVVVWTAYLLFTHQTEPIIGWIILAVDIGVLFWNISVLRAYRIGGGTVVAVFLIVALMATTVSAFAGVEPFSGVKDRVINWFQSTASEATEEQGNGDQYFVDRKLTGYDRNYQPQYQDIYMELTTIAYWEKDTQESPIIWRHPITGSRHPDWIIEFEAHQAQWVINWYYEPRATTPLDLPDYRPTLKLVVWPKATFDSYFWTSDRGFFEFPIIMEADSRGVSDKSVHCTVVHQAGDYVIVITPSAVEDIVDWWVKVGMEPVTVPASLQNAIVGEWRHGFPAQCPPSMDSRQYEELKKLPENETYYLEFTDSGKVFFRGDENRIFNGTYSFVSDKYIQLNWAVSLVPTAQQFFSQHGVYEIHISEEKMYLTNEHEIEASYRRAS